MRNIFPGFYSPTEADFKKLWSEGIFIFDTNVLLDLYRYSDETVENLISTMEKIKERIWIPYRIAFEYHRRLNDIIKGQATEYSDAIKMLTSFNEKFQAKRSHPFLQSNLHREIEDFTKKFDVELKDKQKIIQKLILQNPTKEKLADIIDGAVGNPFTDKELEEIYFEGAKRYSEKTPPGYMDKGQKQGNEIYGDLVIWKEICRKATEIDKPIILVTGDVKEDWFQIVLGMTVGPRPELIDEIKKSKNLLFYIYPTDVFLRRAKEALEVEIKEGTLNEIEEVIKESRKNQENLNSAEECIKTEAIEQLNEVGSDIVELNSSSLLDIGNINGQIENNASV
ncbi:MAG: PIN-like domain-containing protein [Bacteroidota bacterium]